MKKISKILVALLLGIVALFGVVGCNADTQSELQSQIDELQSQIEEMNDKLTEMEEQLRECDGVIEDLNDQIKHRDKHIEQLEKKFAEMADDSQWTNYNAVYAYVKAGFENDILKDVEGAFESLHFQKVYVTAKNTNGWTPLRLLFVLEKDGTENIQDFIRLLQQDERINGASPCRDIAFETVDTRYIKKEKETIAVGEEMRLTLKGYLDGYVQPFDFGGLYAKPSINKNYTIEDFRGIDLKSVIKKDNGWLYLELAEENYFNIIKAADILSRLPEMEVVDFDTSNVTIPIPPIWEISDYTVASLVTDMNDYGSAIVKGLKPGEVTVEFAGVSCKIKVI